MVGRQEGANHKKRSWLVLKAGPGRADGPGDCKCRSDWKAVGSWKKRESQALFHSNTVEARSRSLGPPGSLKQSKSRNSGKGCLKEQTDILKLPLIK
uniref:Uncharacterized protein n=1 Tax=Marmota marmota marmota TaxID=9994 RepID=A0A8C6ES07_MARMA